ncbi:hypothetical protein V2W45_1245369 [Cenococcum geophilum]
MSFSKMAPIEITGNVRNHFIQAAVLLHMLDPVRGEPTVHGLDQDLNDRSALRFQELKRKFLDSFAFLCATKKDGDSVSAACMEEGLPQGTIIRIASNAGVRENTLCQLRQVLDSLNILDASTAETEILLKIITLDIAKIRYYLKDIRATKNILEEPVSAIELRLRESSTSILHTDPSALQRFLKWFRQVFEIRDLPLDPEPTVLIRYIRWAQEAKQHYLEFLKGAFSTNTQQLPRWVCTVFKLGRYGIACKVLVQLASEIPALFNPMIVKPVPAPVSTRFTFPEQELPLTCVLRRVVRRSADKYLSRLATVWNTVDPEALFRTACPLNLTVHAEMQLLNFYDHNCQFKPSFRFMGVSKKSCYLCYMFLATHPEPLVTSSCHQKLYVSWMPPPATDPKLSKKMEATAKQDLESRLGSSRRPVPAESTAGVSLSGLTSSSLAREETQHPVKSWNDSVESQNATENVESEKSLCQTEVVNLTPYEEEELYLDSSNTLPITAMVFHFMRADDATKQDIVSMGDILGPSTNCPSWAKLVKILEIDDGLGLGFKEGREFFMVNNRIRVTNGRQFLACLQYLRNSKVLNSEVFVYSR